MAIAYLKKASKTPATGTDETRKIVTEMLSNIEQGGLSNSAAKQPPEKATGDTIGQR